MSRICFVYVSDVCFFSVYIARFYESLLLRMIDYTKSSIYEHIKWVVKKFHTLWWVAVITIIFGNFWIRQKIRTYLVSLFTHSYCLHLLENWRFLLNVILSCLFFTFANVDFEVLWCEDFERSFNSFKLFFFASFESKSLCL